MRGQSADLKRAIATQRAVVAALAEKTAALMHELGVDPEAHLADVAAALQAALVDPVVAAQLEAGRLARAPERAAGFPAVDDDDDGAAAAATADDAHEPPAPARLRLVPHRDRERDDKAARRRRMLADARAEADDARDALAAAERSRAEAAAAHEPARAEALAYAQEAARLADEAEQASRRADDADARARELEERVRAAERAVDEGRRLVEKAEAHAAALSAE